MIKIVDASIFGDILRKVCQHSPVIRVEKLKNRFVISSMSTDELSFASIVFNESFFEEWDNQGECSLLIESRTLYDVSKVIKAKSTVNLELSDERVHFEIKDRSFKEITITGLIREPNTIEKPRTGRVKTKFKIKSKEFLNVIKELNNLLDEARLLQRDSNNIVFSGKRSGMNVKIHLGEVNSGLAMDGMCIEFPIRFFQHFLPLLNHFEELSLTFGQKTPLRIEGHNERWKLALMVSKIEKPTQMCNVD